MLATARRHPGCGEASSKDLDVISSAEPENVANSTDVPSVEDRTRIDLRLEHERLYWCKKFQVTPEQLREAVEAAGPLAGAVQRYLQLHGARAPRDE